MIRVALVGLGGFVEACGATAHDASAPCALIRRASSAPIGIVRRAVRWLILVLFTALLVGCQSEPSEPWKPVPAPRVVPPPSTPDVRNAPAHFHISPSCSRTIMGGYVDLPFGVMLIAAIALVAIHRRRAKAERALDQNAPLTDGPSVIFGVVEIEPGEEGPPVEVRIHQVGKEQLNKGTWSHSWTEVRREELARPFYLRRDDGERVLVTPGSKFALKDSLSRYVVTGASTRTRIAEVTPGERIYVAGTLKSAGRARAQSVYRGNQGGPTLMPPPFGRMEISAERPGEVEAARASFHRGWLIGLAIVFSLINLLVIPTYRLLALDGAPVRARAAATRHWQVWVKPKNQPGYWKQHYAVQARYTPPGGAEMIIEDECGPALQSCAATGTCTEIPFIVSAHMPTVHQIGSAPMLTDGRVALLFILTFVLVISYPVTAFSTRPWYSKRKLNESGTGRLATSKPA